MGKLLFAAILLLVTGESFQEEVVITVFATDLNGCDNLSACDAEVKIMCQSASSDWRNCGTAKEMGDDNFPLFQERFYFDYNPSENQRWRFDVNDKDVLIDDPIGSASVTLAEFVNATATQKTMKFDLGTRGRLYVHRRAF